MGFDNYSLSWKKKTKLVKKNKEENKKSDEAFKEQLEERDVKMSEVIKEKLILEEKNLPLFIGYSLWVLRMWTSRRLMRMRCYRWRK